MDIAVTHVLTYRTARTIVAARRRLGRLEGLCAASTVMGVVSGLLGGWDTRLVTFVAMPVALVATLELSIVLAWRRVRGTEQTYELTDDVLRIRSRGMTTTLEWSDVARVERHDATWVLVTAVTRVRAVLVKSAFPPRQGAAVDAFLRSRWPGTRQAAPDGAAGPAPVGER